MRKLLAAGLLSVFPGFCQIVPVLAQTQPLVLLETYSPGDSVYFSPKLVRRIQRDGQLEVSYYLLLATESPDEHGVDKKVISYYAICDLKLIATLSISSFDKNKQLVGTIYYNASTNPYPITHPDNSIAAKRAFNYSCGFSRLP